MLIDNLMQMMKNYRMAYLKDDLLAGLTVTTIALPQNMAYALIAGVDPIYGLYTSIVSMIAATFFGISSYMVVGPTNIIALAIASSLGFLEGPEYLQGMFLLTLLVGVLQILLGVLKLGDLVNYVSHPVIVGLTTGVAILIIVGQLGNLMGLQGVNGNNAIMNLYELGFELGNINYYSLMVGLLTIGLIYLIKRYRPALPAYLISLLIVIVVVYIFDLNTRIEMVRGFTSSLPAFRVPAISFTRIQNLLTSALSIALIGFIQVLSIVKSFEKRSGEEIELNREFIGQGIVNIICSFFQSFAITGSFTNSFANYEAGARTRISQLITGISIMLTVIVLRPLVEFVPITALAGIVIYVAYTMFNRDEFLQVVKTTNFDAIVLFATLITTIIAPRLDYAVFFGVFVSFLLVLRNTSDINYSHMEYLRRADDDFALQNIEDVQDDKYIIINLSGTLHFNSAQNLKRKLKDSFRENKVYVIRMRDVDDIDHTSLQELERFINRVGATGGEVILCGVNPRIYDHLEKYGIIDKVQQENVFCGTEHIFSSTKDAIEKARRRSQ